MAGKTISRALLAVIPLFAFAPVVVEAGTPAAAAAAALVADDACATRTHDAPKPGCALEALQTARAAVGSTVAHRAGENPTAKDNLEKEIQFAKVATEEIGLTLECDSPPCAVRGEEDWDSADHPLTSATARIGARSPGCFEWNAYFWPQASFWAGQIGRRLETVGFDNMQNLTRVRKFAHQAAYLVSVMYMDPRSGHHWSEQVQSFFTQVAESDSLDMPMLPEFFRAASKRSKMLVSIINLGWFEGLACDLAWWQRELAGSHADDPLCWSKVQHPGYGYSPAGSSITRPLPAIPADIDPLDHPEYLACQDYPLNSTYYEGICPFGGHVQHWNGIEHWGKGVPKRGQEAVFQCQQTLGIGGFTDLMKHPQMEILFYDNPNISLGPMWEDNKTINPEDVNWTGRFNKEVNDRWMQNIFDAVHHKEAPASLVAEAAVLRGNRGTGLSPGSWKLDGGVMVGGVNVDQTFEMYMDVASISDDEIVFSVLEKSYIWGHHLDQTYSDMHCSYTNWGGRSSEMGYRCDTKICNTGGDCLNQLFWEENQKKGRAQACWSVFCMWGETKNEVSRAS